MDFIAPSRAPPSSIFDWPGNEPHGNPAVRGLEPLLELELRLGLERLARREHGELPSVELRARDVAELRIKVPDVLRRADALTVGRVDDHQAGTLSDRSGGAARLPGELPVIGPPGALRVGLRGFDRAGIAVARGDRDG